MFTRKRIYDRLRKLGKSEEFGNPLFTFYSEVMTSKNTGSMVEHFQNMVDSIIREGTAIPVSAQQMKKREQLGLPAFQFDKDEIKRIIKKSNQEGDR
jgi:hypothetical protein